MPLPQINITFKTLATTAIERSQKGVVGIIIKDTAVNGAHVLTKASQIPATLGTANKAYISRAFTGYTRPVRKVIVYVEPADAADLTAGLTYFKSQIIDYLVGPPDISTTEANAVAAWITAQRADDYTPKAVLPNLAADNEAVVNFTTDGIKVGSDTFTAAQFCSRIAGLIAGTPITISSTYAPLYEVADVTRLSKDDMDTAIDAGKFILFNDSVKVKVGRGVNSLQTLTDQKSESYKKIKIIEAIDMIKNDIKMTAQDKYIGKYANSYDNKCLLISAIKDYFTALELQGILAAGTSTVDIDLDAQEEYLQLHGIVTNDMTDKEIRMANTGDQVFLKATISILDAIEDITLNITV